MGVGRRTKRYVGCLIFVFINRFLTFIYSIGIDKGIEKRKTAIAPMAVSNYWIKEEFVDLENGSFNDWVVFRWWHIPDFGTNRMNDLVMNGMDYFIFLSKRKAMRYKLWNSIWGMNGVFEYILENENWGARILFGFYVLEDSSNNFIAEDKFWGFGGFEF